MDRIAFFVDGAESRRARLDADLAAFIARHGREVDDLSPEESIELFAILLAQSRHQAEMQALVRLLESMSS